VGGIGVLLVSCGTRSAHLFEVSRNALFNVAQLQGEWPSLFMFFLFAFQKSRFNHHCFHIRLQFFWLPLPMAKFPAQWQNS
jgi:hypothetical protein